MSTPSLALFGAPSTFAQFGLPGWSWRWPRHDAHSAKVIHDYLAAGKPLSIPGREGPILALEEAWEQRVGRKHGVYCSSGTMALYSAFFSLGIGPSDEVIAPVVTYHASASPALHLGATVVLVDVDSRYGTMCPHALIRAITPRTKAVVTNAQWGHPVDKDAIGLICRDHNLRWIEDFSHAHLSKWKGRFVGSFGDIACASLQGPKLISGGEGGILLTDDPVLHDRAVLLGHNLKRSQTTLCAPADWPQDVRRSGLGLKLRGHPLAALLVLDQLDRQADEFVEQRTNSLTRLNAHIASLPGARPMDIATHVESMGAWYGFLFQVDEVGLAVSRDKIIAALVAEGVPAKAPGSPPLHSMGLFAEISNPVGQCRHMGPFPGEAAYARGRIDLPTFTGPEDEAALQATMTALTKVWNNLAALR
jgi:dTDP-4-amino-4,6-dideoxygalactose transaminase